MTIEFKDLISKSDLTDSSAGLGGHAHVFEISIQSKTYALKIVRRPRTPSSRETAAKGGEIRKRGRPAQRGRSAQHGRHAGR